MRDVTYVRFLGLNERALSTEREEEEKLIISLVREMVINIIK